MAKTVAKRKAIKGLLPFFYDKMVFLVHLNLLFFLNRTENLFFLWKMKFFENDWSICCTTANK